MIDDDGRTQRKGEKRMKIKNQTHHACIIKKSNNDKSNNNSIIYNQNSIIISNENKNNNKLGVTVDQTNFVAKNWRSAFYPAHQFNHDISQKNNKCFTSFFSNSIYYNS